MDAPGERTAESTVQRVSVEGADQQVLAGVNDANLVELGRTTGARVVLRGDHLALSGDPEAVARAQAMATAAATAP